MIDWQDYETPCYLIDLKKFEQNCRAIMDPFLEQWEGRVEFGYSVKTNHDANLIRYAVEKMGWYVETVSADEYAYARQFTSPQNIILNGPCKGETLSEAYRKGSIINLDHMEEVKAYEAFFSSRMEGERPGAGLRVNFDLEALCPGETTAGEEVSRFGICYENGDFGRAVDILRSAGAKIDGLHLHTSTKSRSAKVFTMLARKAVEIAKEYDLKLRYVDMGGGFFGGQRVEGKPTMEEYASCICRELREGFTPQETRLILEPGASVLATSVEYLTRVHNIRDIRGERVVTLDGTLLHINPFMNHRTPPYRLEVQQEREKVQRQLICGCTCMENDRFFTAEDITRVEPGDMFLFQNAGAYTQAFNSDFILHPPKVYTIG